MTRAVVLLLVSLCACSSNDPALGDLGGDGSGDGDGRNSGDSTASDDGPTDLPGACSDFAAALGVTRVATGAYMQPATASAAPFDVHYVYIASELPNVNTCTSCTSNCSAGTNWWGCWQDTSLAPGLYVRSFIAAAKARGQTPMFTYYQVLQAAGYDPDSEMAFIANDDGMRRYYADFKRLLENIGNERVILHIEPDFWGHLQIEGANDAHAKPAAVARVNSDCSAHPNDGAGFGRCLITMTRKYAPNTLVGLHASVWGTLIDVLDNTSSSFNLQGEAAKLGNFMRECGAAGGDFIASDMADRDAGYYETVQGVDAWLNTNATLPNFSQALTWGGHLATNLGLPIVWWQIPMGNAAQNNTPNHYKDNRVDYLFGHMDEVAAGHVAGLFFGTGQSDQTNAESDGGNLVAKVNAYADASTGMICE